MKITVGFGMLLGIWFYAWLFDKTSLEAFQYSWWVVATLVTLRMVEGRKQ